MTLRTSRRRAVQMALATTAAAALPTIRVAARQATPVTGGSAAISAAKVEAALGRLDGLIEDAMARAGVPGAAVAVVSRDDVVYERGFGVREVGKTDSITPETIFQIASMSKSISSTLVAAVVGDGVATWDATIASLEPGFALADPIASAQVTLRDMFCHRSGLPEYAGDELYFNFGYERDETVRRLRYVPAATPFRTAFAYENVGLAAAAYAAARAAGLEWEDLAEVRLLAPLGMSSTSYRFADFLAQENRAAPHYKTREGAWDLGKETDDDAAAPAGGVSSSVRDLTRWLRLQLADGAFEGQQVVASAPLLETHRPQIVAGSPPDPAAGPTSFYGLGWYVEYDNRGRLLLQHGGDFSDGYRTGAYLLPAAGLGIVVLTNGWPNSLRDAIPRAFLEMVEQGEPTRDWVGDIEAATTAALAQMLATSFPQGAPPPSAVPSLPLVAYAGTYTNQLFGDLIVREEGGGLALELGPHPIRHTLRHWDRDTFSYDPAPSEAVLFGRLGVSFTIGPDGRATAALLSIGGLGPNSTATFMR